MAVVGANKTIVYLKWDNQLLSVKHSNLSTHIQTLERKYKVAN